MHAKESVAHLTTNQLTRPQITSLDIGENRKSQMRLASFFGRDTADNLSPVIEGLLTVERSLLTRES